MSNLGRDAQRDREVVARPHCQERRDDAIHRSTTKKAGLLRFARNDGPSAISPLPPRALARGGEGSGVGGLSACFSGSEFAETDPSPPLRGGRERRSNRGFLLAVRSVASQSLSSTAHSRDPLARNDNLGDSVARHGSHRSQDGGAGCTASASALLTPSRTPASVHPWPA